MSYLLSPYVGRLYVRTNPAGIPDAFTWQGRMHTVVTLLECWKMRDQWWSQPVQRDYFKLTTSLGWLVVLYHDLYANTWHLERLLD